MYEVFERMAYYGISSNLVIYMTTKLHQGTVKSSNNVTNWVGTSWLTPILGAYVADAHLGRYITFVISGAIYFTVRLFLIILSIKEHKKQINYLNLYLYCYFYRHYCHFLLTPTYILHYNKFLLLLFTC